MTVLVKENGATSISLDFSEDMGLKNQSSFQDAQMAFMVVDRSVYQPLL